MVLEARRTGRLCDLRSILSKQALHLRWAEEGDDLVGESFLCVMLLLPLPVPVVAIALLS